MSPSTSTLPTSGRAPTTASSASRLLWMSERSASFAAGSGVDALVHVEEEDPGDGRHRHRQEESQDPAQVAPGYEGEDDQHRAQVDRVAVDLGRDEVVDDVRDHGVDDYHQDHLAHGLGDEGGHRDRRQGTQEGPYEGDEGGHAGDDAQ